VESVTIEDDAESLSVNTLHDGHRRSVQPAWVGNLVDKGKIGKIVGIVLVYRGIHGGGV
jgi:hypothetical protein